MKWDNIPYISTLPSYIFTIQGLSGIASDCKLFHFIDIKSMPLPASFTVHFVCSLVKNSLYKQVEQKKTVNGNNLWKHTLWLCISFLYCAVYIYYWWQNFW